MVTRRGPDVPAFGVEVRESGAAPGCDAGSRSPPSPKILPSLSTARHGATCERPKLRGAPCRAPLRSPHASRCAIAIAPRFAVRHCDRRTLRGAIAIAARFAAPLRAFQAARRHCERPSFAVRRCDRPKLRGAICDRRELRRAISVHSSRAVRKLEDDQLRPRTMPFIARLRYLSPLRSNLRAACANRRVSIGMHVPGSARVVSYAMAGNEPSTLRYLVLRLTASSAVTTWRSVT